MKLIRCGTPRALLSGFFLLLPLTILLHLCLRLGMVFAFPPDQRIENTAEQKGEDGGGQRDDIERHAEVRFGHVHEQPVPIDNVPVIVCEPCTMQLLHNMASPGFTLDEQFGSTATKEHAHLCEAANPWQ